MAVACFDYLRHMTLPVSVKCKDIHAAYYDNFVRTKRPIRVGITGVAGQIGYALVPMIAAGDMFGPDQPVIIQGVDLDIPAVKESLKGLKMELEDGEYPLLVDVVFTTEVGVAFKDVDYAILLGASPRLQGMERKDLMEKNIAIFRTMGEAIEQHASKDIRVLVVGNPANTNCLIASHYAPSIPKKNFSALTRLDMNRAKGQIALKAGVNVEDVKNAIIWGNHSSTQYPDVSHATIKGKPVKQVLSEHTSWLQGPFIELIQKRGAVIINARKASSALSAARGVITHINSWHCGTKEGEYVSMGVFTDGNEGYDIAKGLIYSFPVTCKNGDYTVVKGLAVDSFSKTKLQATEDELKEERTLAFEILGK